MCDEQNDNMDSDLKTCTKTYTQKIRIVKFDRAIPVIQLLLLAAALILLAVTLAGNDVSRFFLAMALFVILTAVAWRVRCLYKAGLTFEVEFLDQESETRLALGAEKILDNSDTAEGSPAEEDTAELETADDGTDRKHWTEVNYPDPDVELGLKEPPEDIPEEEKTGTGE